MTVIVEVAQEELCGNWFGRIVVGEFERQIVGCKHLNRILSLVVDIKSAGKIITLQSPFTSNGGGGIIEFEDAIANHSPDTILVSRGDLAYATAATRVGPFLFGGPEGVSHPPGQVLTHYQMPHGKAIRVVPEEYWDDQLSGPVSAR